MTRPVRFQVLRGMHEPYEPAAGEAQASYERRRAAVLSYEQLVAGKTIVRRAVRPFAVMPAQKRRDIAEEIAREIGAEQLARDPLAHPVAPARPPGAARPVYVVPPEAAEYKPEAAAIANGKHEPAKPKTELPAIEPVEPDSEPRPGGPAHGGAEVPERSRLSPSQRAALKRPEKRLDRDGRPTFVTYTVDTGKK